MILTFCDRCRKELTGVPCNVLMLIQSRALASKELGLIPQGDQKQTPIGVVCDECAEIHALEAKRLLTMQVQKEEAA